MRAPSAPPRPYPLALLAVLSACGPSGGEPSADSTSSTSTADPVTETSPAGASSPGSAATAPTDDPEPCNNDGKCDMFEYATHCPGDCTRCGDGVVSGDEKCDDETEGNGLYGYCKTDCSGRGPHCGDGDCFSGQEDFTNCSQDCDPECGNGIVEGPEPCDDIVDTALCTDLCTLSTCGDGYVNPATDELCDDGNQIDGDGCSDACRPPRRVFVSSVTYQGDLSPMRGLTGLALADAHCQSLADQAAHGTGAIASDAIFRAWLSDATGSPATRFDTTYIGHYQLVDGTPIASGWFGLTSGALTNPIHRTESGELVAQDQVWTNTLASGEAASDLSCAGWSSSMPNDGSRHGRASRVDAGWSDVGQAPCDAKHHLYCVQDGPGR